VDKLVGEFRIHISSHSMGIGKRERILLKNI